MKKNNYTLSALILGLLCLELAACSKSEGDNQSPISYPLEVKATALEEQGPVKLYTKDGEVTDQAVIAKFIANAEYFDAPFVPDEEASITFLEATRAQFGMSATPYEVKVEGNNRLLFMSDFLIDNSGQIGGLMDSYAIGKNNAPLEAQHYLSGSRYKGKEIRLAQGNYHRFILPILAFKLRRYKGYEPINVGGDETMAVVFNELAPAFLNKLNPRDTLACQQSYVRFGE